jgi:hypothetical protein
MNLDLTQELAPDSSIDEAEFKFVAPLPEWDNDKDSSVAFDRSLNRYGAVYVRLLKAQRYVRVHYLRLLSLWHQTVVFLFEETFTDNWFLAQTSLSSGK